MYVSEIRMSKLAIDPFQLKATKPQSDKRFEAIFTCINPGVGLRELIGHAKSSHCRRQTTAANL
jgi:hypothetical protein